jgi:hypothetical protein
MLKPVLHSLSRDDKEVDPCILFGCCGEGDLAAQDPGVTWRRILFVRGRRYQAMAWPFGMLYLRSCKAWVVKPT